MDSIIWNLLDLKKPLWQHYVDHFSQSKWIIKLNQALYKPCPHLVEAEQEYQDIAKDALKDVPYPHPIMIDNNMNNNEGEVAHEKRGVISINHVYLSFCSYGVKRFVLFHESRHQKFNDHTMSAVLTGFMCSLSYYSTLVIGHMVKMNFKMNLLCSFSVGLMTCFLFSQWYTKKIELRTDIEAAHIQCHQCVYEWSNLVGRDTITNGYLGKIELLKISEYYKTNKQLCQYHQ